MKLSPPPIPPHARAAIKAQMAGFLSGCAGGGLNPHKFPSADAMNWQHGLHLAVGMLGHIGGDSRPFNLLSFHTIHQ